MSVKFPSTYSTINKYLDTELDEKNVYINVSVEQQTLIAEEWEETTAEVKNQEQTSLFNWVIAKLKSCDSLKLPGEESNLTYFPLTFLKKYQGFELYISNSDIKKDPLYWQVELVVATFSKKLFEAKSDGSTLQAYHRFELANALELHKQVYFKPKPIQNTSPVIRSSPIPIHSSSEGATQQMTFVSAYKKMSNSEGLATHKKEIEGSKDHHRPLIKQPSHPSSTQPSKKPTFTLPLDSLSNHQTTELSSPKTAPLRRSDGLINTNQDIQKNSARTLNRHETNRERKGPRLDLLRLKSSKLSNPYSRIKKYLGISIDEKSKYIMVSPNKDKIQASGLQGDALTENKNQIALLELVIEKLIGEDELQLPLSSKTKTKSSSASSKEKPDGFEAYLSGFSNLDKVEAIAVIFFKRFTDAGLSGDRILTYHRFSLANALKLHMQLHFESFNLDPDYFHLGAKYSPKSSPRGGNIHSNSSAFRNMGIMDPTGTSPYSSERIPPRKISHGSPLQDSDNSLRRKSKEHDSLSVPKSLYDRVKYVRPKKGQPEIDPNEIVIELSEKCLQHCLWQWIYERTKENAHKQKADIASELMTSADRTQLTISQFLGKPKLGMILQEDVIRSLNDINENTTLPHDIDRTFELVTVSDSKEGPAFHYDLEKAPKKEENEKNKHKNEIKKAKYDCEQFGLFLGTILKNLEQAESFDTHPLVKTWGECVHFKKKSDSETNLFQDSLTMFLNEIRDQSRYKMQRGTKYKLSLLLNAFSQKVYTPSAAALIQALPGIIQPMKTENTNVSKPIITTKIKFLSDSKVEVYVSKMIKLAKDDHLEYVSLNLVNTLNADLFDFETWSSQINVQVIPGPDIASEQIENDVTKPFENIGIEVQQTQGNSPTKSINNQTL